MILDVFDKNFNRIDNLSRYSYSQYEKELNSVGSFEVDIPLDETALMIKSQAAFILFEREILGCITFINPDIDTQTQSSTMIIKGYMVNCLLDRRCVYKTANYTGTRTSIARQLLTEFFINPEDTKRAMPIILSNDPTYNPSEDTARISMQTTGDSIQNLVESLMGTNEMGYDLVPNLTNTGISNLEFRVIYGKDRTVGNINNPPVIFSSNLKNILESSYKINNNDYKNVAYVAGEGEGSSRIVVDTGVTEATGFDRYELYVDARDLQKDDGETVLTPTEYEKVLINRGKDKLNEHLIEEVYSASIDTINTQFVYGRDFNLGDLVTIQDVDLGISMNARVTQVSATSIGEKDIIEVTFGYYRLSTMKKLVKNGVI